MGAHKRKRRSGRSPPIHNAHHLFAQTLAAYSNIDTHFSQSLILKLLKIHLSLIRNTTSLSGKTAQLRQADPFLSLLPFLLNTRYPKISSCSAEIVGAMALLSLESNTFIALDKEIIDALVKVVGSQKKQVVMAACNAMLDLSTTSIGRERLRECSAIQNLLSVFCKVATSPMKLGSLCKRKNIRGNCLRIRYVEDKLLLVVLEAVENLINTCSVELLEKIARELSVASLICLKDIWAKMQDLVSECSDQEGRDTWSSIKPPDLAEMVFRLSMNHCCHTTCTSDTIKRSIFGPEESNIVNFILNNWEVSPVLLSMRSKTSKENDSIFSFLTKCFNGKTIDYILDSILGRLVSCPPIASDELSILNFLEEVRGRLGCPIVYGQDLRVIKTVGPSKKEVHFWDNSVVFSIDNDCVEGCKEAYHNGYTIALRGMEFRTEKVAAIADGLEMLLGQLSVGANVYLTPPRSQGLARHCDDHCVFVCQLLGKKKWAVFPQSIQLPRLYDPLGSVLGSEGGNDGCESKQFLLREGDVLYIPRGCPHEAHTVTGDSESQIDEASEFSLHLTLGIEVEPPFEWEGFAHIALHCWNENRKHTTDDLIKSKLQIPSDYFINLLHVAIRVIGDHDTTFRKACMVAAFAFLSDSRGKQNFHSLIMSQRATFSYVINKINAESSFLEAFKVIEVSVLGRNDESLQWMRWLRHLPQEGVADEKMDFNDPLKLFENLVLSYNGDVNDAHAAFLHVKSEFCTSVIFEEASRSFGLLLKKYKKTRKHYMNGMLSLH